MKIKQVFALSISLVFLLRITEAQSVKTIKYGGVYAYGKNPVEGPAGQVTIYPESDSTILFYIDFTVGPPSYNLGQLYGKLRIINGYGIYFSKEPDDKKGCKWQMKIIGKVLTISTIDDSNECGFGNRVSIDYSYKLKDAKIPKCIVDGHGHKIYFAKTSPENYLR